MRRDWSNGSRAKCSACYTSIRDRAATACPRCSLRCWVVFVQARSRYTERSALTRILRSWSYERNNISGIYWVMVLMWIGHCYINQALHQYVLRYATACIVVVDRFRRVLFNFLRALYKCVLMIINVGNQRRHREIFIIINIMNNNKIISINYTLISYMTVSYHHNLFMFKGFFKNSI